MDTQTTLLVSYDISNDWMRAALLEQIKQYAWARLSDSCYLIQGPAMPSLLYGDLCRFAGMGDSLFVCPIGGAIVSHGPAQVGQWLNHFQLAA